ncbi:hypothetical protein ACSSS7_007382 [Eimeria intestinalis]
MILRREEEEGDDERQASGPPSLSATANEQDSSCPPVTNGWGSRAADKTIQPAADESVRDDAPKTTVCRCSKKLQDRISTVVSLQRVLDEVLDSSVAPASSSADPSEDAETAGGPRVFVPKRTIVIRLPFSPQQIPLCTGSSRPCSVAGPSLHTLIVSLLQRTLSCCSSTLKTRLSLEDRLPNSYICAHLLQELAASIQQMTGLTVDPFENQHAHQGAPHASERAESYAAGLRLKEDTTTDQPLGRTSSSYADSVSPKASGLLQRAPEVQGLLKRYSILLAGDEVWVQSLRNIIRFGILEKGKVARKRSSLLMQRFTAPFFSCSPGAPWYFWKKATRLGPRRKVRVSVQLLHVELAGCHLFREEDRVAHRLLEAYEVYAYMARTASGEQLTTKLCSCLESSQQMRDTCGLSQLLHPLLQIAQSTVSVFCQGGEIQEQQEILRQHLQQLPQLALQLQRLSERFVTLKTENVQLWKEWLHHLKQRRILRHQRDHEAHQFAAAGRAVETLWQLLDRQRTSQEFDGTGLQMQILLLTRDEPSDRQQLLEEVISEFEEILTYVVDTRWPESLVGFDLPAAAVAALKKLSDQARRKPGQPLRLLLLSSKANAGSSLSSPSTERVAQDGVAVSKKEDSLLPLQEQLRRFLSRNLSAGVTCRINGRSTGRQEHVTLHFPFFSTTQHHNITFPVGLGSLSPDIQQVEKEQSNSVAAAFEAALSVPLSKLSVHLGLTHPGLAKPLEAQIEVPLPNQLKALTSQLVCGGSAVENQSLAGLAGFPVAVNLDLPFSFTRATCKETQGERVVAASGSKAPVRLLPFGSMDATTVKNNCWASWRPSDSAADMTPIEPCVLPLPSFLSPEATAARYQELQDYPLLNTPQWDPGFRLQANAQDLHQVALAASLVGAESHSRALTTAAAGALGTAPAFSGEGAAAAAVALPGVAIPAHEIPPAAAASKSSGILPLGLRKIGHFVSPAPALPELEDNLKSPSKPAGQAATAAGAPVVADKAAQQRERQNFGAANEASAAALPSQETSRAHDKAILDVFKSAKPSTHGPSFASELLPLHRGLHDTEAISSSQPPAEASSQTSVLPPEYGLWMGHTPILLFAITCIPCASCNVTAAPLLSTCCGHSCCRSCGRVAGCLKLRLLVPPSPQSQEDVNCFTYAGAEWLALRHQLVERKAHGAFEGVCTRRRLPGSKEALASSASSSSPPLLHEGLIEARGEQRLGPSLYALLAVSNTSLQLDSHFQTKACPRFSLRQQQIYVEAACQSLPATDWEAALLTVFSRQSARVDEVARAAHLVGTPRAKRSMGGFYEQKLRRYLLSNEATAAAARELLICLANETSTTACNARRGAEGSFTGPLKSGTPSAEHTAGASMEHVEAPLPLQTKKPDVPYAAIVKEVDWPLMFWRLTEWGLRCNPFYRCRYRAMVLLPVALRQHVLRAEKRQQRRRLSSLWRADEECLPRKCSTVAPQTQVELRAFVRRCWHRLGEVRRLYNVPRRRLPASPAEWHGRYRLGRQPGHKAPGFENFALYEAAQPAAAGTPETFTPPSPAVDILQLSCPIVALRVCVPDLGIDVFTATTPTEGENPAINQALSVKLPQLSRFESEGLYRQRGSISISVFDQLRPRPLADARSARRRLPLERSEGAAPLVFLGSFELEWRSLLSSAEATASRIVGPAAAAEVFCHDGHPYQHRIGPEYQQKVLAELLGVGQDGTCCLCVLNGCFRLRQPRGLLSHSRVAHFGFPAAGGKPPRVQAPLDMFVSLKLEIRGPAFALFGVRARHILPEDQYEHHQHQRQRQQLPEARPHQTDPYAGLPLNENTVLINHDVRWRQKASRCGVWTPPSVIARMPQIPQFRRATKRVDLLSRLAPFGAAQLWDPLSGEALCLVAEERPQGYLQQPDHRQRQTPLQEDEELWKKQLDILASLQRVDNERQSVRQRTAMLFPAAERLAASQYRKLHLASTQETVEKEGTAAAKDRQFLEHRLAELQAQEDALLDEWRSLHAAASRPLPFLIGGPQQKSQEGLWPISRLSLLFNQQNAYMNLQPMSCCNCRSSPAEASAPLLVAEDSSVEFVPLTASTAIPEDERHLRQTIRGRLQKRRRWRCLGVPALTHALRAVARAVKTHRWWLRWYLKFVAFLCCDRWGEQQWAGSNHKSSLHASASHCILLQIAQTPGSIQAGEAAADCSTCLFHTTEAPYESRDVDVVPLCTTEYKRLGAISRRAASDGTKSSGAQADLAAAKAAQILGVHGKAVTRISLLPPTGGLTQTVGPGRRLTQPHSMLQKDVWSEQRRLWAYMRER